MQRRRLLVTAAIGVCLFGSSLAAYTSVIERRAIDAAALSSVLPPAQPDLTIAGTGGSRLSLKSVPAVSNSNGLSLDSIVGMRPTAAARADFDDDGTPDLVAAYGDDDAGTIVIWRGNVDALYPNAPEAASRRADGSFSDAPFLGVLSTTSISISPEFVAVGDFDGDGHADVLATRAGANSISRLSGDGKGSLAEDTAIELPGDISALATGDVGQNDGHDDVVLGLSTADGPRLAVLKSGSPSFGKDPELIPVRALPTTLSVSRVGDDGPTDIVAASGSTMWLLNGVSSNTSDTRSFDARAIVRDLPFEPVTITVGNFAGSKRRDVALLDQNGAVHVLAQMGERDYTAQASALTAIDDLSSSSDWRLLDSVWSSTSASTSRPVMSAARLSGGMLDDLVVPNGPDAMSVLMNGNEVATKTFDPRFEAVVESIATPFETAAVLPMRLNGDALSDLVFLGAGGSVPSTIVSAPRLTFTVTNVADSGAGSLRQAILSANGSAGFDDIQFAIPGGGPHIINLLTELPQLVETCSIDATTQPGFSGSPVVRVHGGTIPGNANGFNVIGGSTLIRGFSITGFAGSVLMGNGILFPSGSGDSNTIEGNFIGVDTGGVTVIANASDGIRGEAGSDNHVIGGTVAGARNVSTANSDGIQLSNTTGAMIRGNYLGPNATGTSGPGNVASGCRLIGTTGCVVGGSAAGSLNVISANAQEGIVVNTAATGNVVAGNFIGMDVTGDAPLSNGTIGVNIVSANATTIGGPAAGDRNIISANLGGGISAPVQSQSIQNNAIGLSASGVISFGNGPVGVTVGGMNSSVTANEIVGHSSVGLTVSGAGAFVISNSIFGNGTAVIASATGIFLDSNFIGQNNAGVTVSASVVCTNNTFVQDIQPLFVTGATSSDLRLNRFFSCGTPLIDLNADGPTANDAGDVDAGPNGLQNFPVITSVVAVPGGTAIAGVLNSSPSASFDLTFYSSSACSPGDAQILQGSLVVMTDGAGAAPFVFNATALPPGTGISATATKTSVALPVTSEFSACTPVAVSADVSSTIADTPDPVFAGNNVTYTITIDNAGPSPASMLSFTQSTPPATTFVSIAPAGGWSCTTPPMGGSGSITCTAPSMAPSSAIFTVTMAVPPNAGGSVLTSSVTVSASSPDPMPGNDASMTSTNVSSQADLSVTLLDSPDPVAAGAPLTLDATLTNAGPSDALSAAFSQPVPAGTTFAAFSAPPGWSCSTPPMGGTGTVTCTSPMIPASGVSVFSLTVDVPANAVDGSIISSSAVVTAATSDPNGADNTANATTTVANQADLSVTLLGSPNPVTAGNALSYVVDAGNSGPNNAANASVSFSTPAGTTFAALSAPPGWNCTAPAPGDTGGVSCTNSLLAASGSASFLITVNVLPDLTDGTTIVASATVASTTPDLNTANNSAGESTTVGVAADLAISSSSEPETVNAGETVTYTVTATNFGPSDAVNVAISMPVPAGMSFESATADSGTCSVPDVGATSGEVICTWAGVTSVGGMRTATITMRAMTTLDDGTLVSNTAIVSSSTIDPDSTNNLATGSVTVLKIADLSLTVVNVPDPVGPGSTLVSTMTVTNNGPVAASSVFVNTATPTGTVFGSIQLTQGTATTPAVGETGPIVVSLGDMPNGSIAVITIACLVTAEDGSSITTSASLSSLTTDPDTDNDAASTSAGVSTTALQSDISTAVTLDPPEVVSGSDTVFIIEVGNAGPDPATDVVLTQTLPPGTVLRDVSTTQGTFTAPAAGSGGTVRVQLGSMVVGSTATVRIAVQVTASSGTTVLVSSITSSSSSDPNPFNNASLGELDVRTGASVLLDWLPPNFDEPVNFPPPRSLTISTVPSKSAASHQLPKAAGFASPREPRATLVGYNIYRSNRPGTQPLPANFFTQVPAGTTTVTVSTSPGGSFFVVTAQYDEGESGASNEASGNIEAADLTRVRVQSSKIVAFGEGFTDVVQVFIDGIPFQRAAKLKLQGTKVIQKGNLLTGQTIGQYIASRGGVVIISFRNSNGGIATYRVGE